MTRNGATGKMEQQEESDAGSVDESMPSQALAYVEAAIFDLPPLPYSPPPRVLPLAPPESIADEQAPLKAPKRRKTPKRCVCRVCGNVASGPDSTYELCGRCFRTESRKGNRCSVEVILSKIRKDAEEEINRRLDIIDTWVSPRDFPRRMMTEKEANQRPRACLLVSEIASPGAMFGIKASDGDDK